MIRTITMQHFTHNAMVNSHLEKGGWAELILADMNIPLIQLVEIIEEIFDPEDTVTARIIFQY